MFSRKKITQVVLNWLNSSLCRLCNIPDLPADWHLWWMINKWCTLGMLGGSRFTINMLKTWTLEIIVVFIIIFRVMSVQVGRLIDWQIINWQINMPGADGTVASREKSETELAANTMMSRYSSGMSVPQPQLLRVKYETEMGKKFLRTIKFLCWEGSTILKCLLERSFMHTAA